METTGHNDTVEVRSFRHFFIPTWVEITFLGLSSVIITGVANAHLIWLLATDGARVDQQTVSQTLQPQIDSLNHFFRQEVFGGVAVFLIWGVIGCVAYMSIWSLQRTYQEAKDDVDQSNYVQSGGRQSYWHGKIAHYIYLACAWFVLSVFLIGFISLLLPLANSLTAATLHNYQYLHSYLYLLEGVTLIMASLYILSRLWRTARYVVKTD